MSNQIIKTFKKGSNTANFQLFFLSKELNSGKPLENPCPNCFVINCESQEQVKFYKCVGYALWKKQIYSPYLTGSVVPFIRIGDFRIVFSQGVKLAQKNQNFRKMIAQLQAFEQLESTYLKSLNLIQEAKKAIYFNMFQQ